MTFSETEHAVVEDYAALILAKKGRKTEREKFDRLTSEMGEMALDHLMEKLNMHRIWMRGQFHWDFQNLTGDIRLEVKTRKLHAPNLYECDVRIDPWDEPNLREATHIVPTIYVPNDGDAFIVSPGVFQTDMLFAGIEMHKEKIPRDFKLKFPSRRCPWGIILENPDDFGFMEWEELKGYFKKHHEASH